MALLQLAAFAALAAAASASFGDSRGAAAQNIRVGKKLRVNALANDTEVMPFPSQPPKNLVTRNFTSKVPSTGRNYTIYIAELADAARFSVALPPNGCVNHQTTLYTADYAHCEAATNAGFFIFPPAAACQGSLVINSTVQQWATSNAAGFGIGRDARGAGFSVVGFLPSAKALSGKSLDYFVTGVGWLVRGGKSYVASSIDLNINSTFVTEKAPRTAIGVRKDGTVFSAVVDGEEDIAYGLALTEFAEVLALAGGWHVINLDGGGSSTAVLHGEVWSRPTAFDNSTIIQRNVSSIVCLRYEAEPTPQF